MKNLFLLFLTLINFSNDFVENTILPKKRVDVVLQSTNGCSVHIVGVVSYSLIPPNINDFSGTITISGGAGCPNGTLNFRTSNLNGKNSDLIVKFDNNDYNNLKKIYFEGEKEFVNVLNDEKLNTSLVNVIKEVCR